MKAKNLEHYFAIPRAGHSAGKEGEREGGSFELLA